MESLDEFAPAIRALEQSLKRARFKTSTSQDLYDDLSQVHEDWVRHVQPKLRDILGDVEELDQVDRIVARVRSLVGTRVTLNDLRADLRLIAKIVDSVLLPAYQTARWTQAASPPAERAPTREQPDQIAERLGLLDEALRDSYTQALADLSDESRSSYLGPAGELREVVRGAVHFLTPDDEAIKSQGWFEGHDHRPTQAERIRFILQGQEREHQHAVEAAELVEMKTASIGRRLYRRASKAFHAGTQREEVERIAMYAKAFLLDVVPADGWSVSQDEVDVSD